MTKQASNIPPADGGDEVERSLELLDRVLSEFDDLENGNVALEDDGYMSMNGRRQLKQEFPPPPAEEAQRIISTLLPRVSPSNSSKRTNGRRGRIHTSLTLGHEPRLDRSAITTIATQTTIPKTRHQRPFGWQNGGNSYSGGPSDGSSEWRLPPRTVASVGGERHREVRRLDEASTTHQLAAVVESVDANFSDDSLEDVPPPPPPPQAVAPTAKRGSIAWEVPLDDDEALYTPGSTKVIGRRRRRSTDRSSSGSMGRLRDADEWPDPPTGTEDGSISPLSDSSHLDSSTASRADDLLAELSGTDMSSGGTYVIRKGRRKERKPMPLPPEALQNQPQPPPNQTTPTQNGDLKRSSTTFDNIKSLLRDGLIDGLDEAPPDFAPPNPPAIVRVVSLPSINSEDKPKISELDVPNEEDEDNKPETPEKREIGIQASVEDLDSLPSLPNGITETDSDSEGRKRSVVMVNGTTDTSSNEALMAELKREYDTDSIRSSNNNEGEELIVEDEKPTIEVLAKEVELEDPWLTAAEISQVQVIPVVEEKPPEEEKPPKEFKVKVEVVQHEFGPLPPSPVEEDDEYADVLRPSPAQTPRGKTQGNEKREPFYRCLEPPASDPLGTKFLNKSNPDHHYRDGTSSLKTRSMDAGFTRNHRTHNNSSSRRGEVPSERRTLPTELQGPSRRRTLQKRGNSREDSASVGGTTNGNGHMQVSCSLPETPIFARGCDIPRTPHRRAPDVPVVSRTTPRQMPSATFRNAGMSLNEAMTGAELLRLAGGPARGWYPRHRQARPASVEHLDRLHQGLSPGSHGPPPGPWDPSRKPQTLPPNLTPKFFHRSPREALRRVTSLLIRRGNSKDKKDALSPTSGFTAYFVVGEGAEGSRQKKGFFRSFWKRSRHYSLEQQ
uniref:Replicase polyprotein 1a n=1 Tax=Lygus hesperus TaxID=30085 RepID=A0A0A9VVI5_LYGHE